MDPSEFASRSLQSRICLKLDYRRIRIWRQPGQAEHLRNSVSASAASGSLMFWGGQRTSQVVMECAETALRYINDILRPIVLPYRQNIGEAFVFMDDNSRPHHAHVVNDFLQDDDIARLEWPAYSPDMKSLFFF